MAILLHVWWLVDIDYFLTINVLCMDILLHWWWLVDIDYFLTINVLCMAILLHWWWLVDIDYFLTINVHAQPLNLRCRWRSAPTTSHLNVVVQSPSLHWGGSKWLVDSPRVSSSGDSPSDNFSHFLSLLSNARLLMDSTLKPN